MFLNGACYIRVSTDDQTEFSPDAQLKALKEYAKKNDIVLTKEHIYADEGISGKRADKRPAFMRMIAFAKSKPRPFDVILVHKFDRFARSREDSVVYKSLLKKEAGIKVVSITESIEDDKFAVILEAMLEAMAEYYSLNLAEEVKKGMTEKAERGEFQSSPPFGYTISDKKLIILPDEAEIIKFIFNKFANQEMGFLQLAKYVNDLGVKTKRGNPFENRTIEYILNNPIYNGKVRWTPTCKVKRNYHHPDSIIKESDHEKIIDDEIWEKTQEVLKLRKEIYRKREKSNTNIKIWLSGIIKCKNCNRAMVINNQHYLQCSGYNRGVCPRSNLIKIKTLEDAILEQIKITFQEKLEIDIVPKASDTISQNDVELLEHSLSRLDLKEIRIKEAYQDGIDTLSEYKENKLKIETERQRLTEELNNLKKSLIDGNSIEGDDNIYQRLENVYALLSDESIDIETKYKTAHFLIEQVSFSRGDNILEIKYK